ncbi:MAG: putative Ig domain-containing protein [Phycisphaerales bacterium]|nr:MAG: putative Ig domain-containing protein [Phycisphaerales bacterium]
MFEFKWQLPGTPRKEVALHIRSRLGWFGRKVVMLNGRTIARRGRFEGIYARFRDPDGGRRLEMGMARIEDSPVWRPVLTCDGVELAEITGAAPPRLVERPRLLAIVTGLTYLVMLMAAVMLLSIVKILDAMYLPQDDRRVVLTVVDPGIEPGVLVIEPPRLNPAITGQDYAAELTATGGSPPYEWAPVRRGWPRQWSLDPRSGELTVTPRHVGDRMGTVRVTDSVGQTAECPIVIVVQSQEPVASNWPTIETMHLPSATVGGPYSFDPDVVGGVPPLTWKVVGKRKLPTGLSIDEGTGRIEGTPGPVRRFRLGLGHESELDAGRISGALRLQFEGRDVVLTRHAVISVDKPHSRWRIADGERRFVIAKEGNELSVYASGGHYPVILKVSDCSYDHWDDIRPWLIPFLVTSVCLLGYWNMRKWGVYLYGPLILLQCVAAASGVSIAVSALGLQAIVWITGAVHVRKMF